VINVGLSKAVHYWEPNGSNLENPSEVLKNEVLQKLNTFFKVFRRYWLESRRIYSKFCSNHIQWLNTMLVPKQKDAE